MSEPMALMRSVGRPDRTTQATREALRAVATMYRGCFGGREADAIAPVLDAMIERRRAQSI